MTREEVIDFCEMKSQLEPENEDIFNYIVKIVEQEPILDKIRAEIAELHLIGYATIDGKREIASRAVLQIIDKYMEESEDKE